LIAQQPGQIAYSIFDSKCVKLFMPSVFPAFKSDTLEGLAAQIKLDPVVMAKTIGEYNAGLVPGTFNGTILDDCRTEGVIPPKSHWAQSVTEPPFFAYPLRPGITFTYLGVRVNDQARVLMSDGRPTTNLFATGEIMAGNILGRGYLAGFGMTIGTVFGRIAGREAAKIVRN
jgi:tricarballylate dehydrogenase